MVSFKNLHLFYCLKNGSLNQCKVREFIEEKRFNGAFSFVDNIPITGQNQADHKSFLMDAIRPKTVIESKTISFAKSLDISG